MEIFDLWPYWVIITVETFKKILRIIESRSDTGGLMDLAEVSGIYVNDLQIANWHWNDLSQSELTSIPWYTFHPKEFQKLDILWNKWHLTKSLHLLPTGNFYGLFTIKLWSNAQFKRLIKRSEGDFFCPCWRELGILSWKYIPWEVINFIQYNNLVHAMGPCFLAIHIIIPLKNFEVVCEILIAEP